jgi:hypothetical protein
MSGADRLPGYTSDQHGRDLHEEDRMAMSVAVGIASRGRRFVVTNAHRGRFLSVIVRNCG